jgi:hypothetical protein
MTAWSEYLREQAIVADRVAGTMTSVESRKEFTDIANSYRRDADIEDDTAAGSDPVSRLPRRKTSQACAAAMQAMHG